MATWLSRHGAHDPCWVEKYIILCILTSLRGNGGSEEGGGSMGPDVPRYDEIDKMDGHDGRAVRSQRTYTYDACTHETGRKKEPGQNARTVL